VDLVFDTSKPDGTPRKLLDVGRLHGLGWQHRIALRPGIEQTYRWFLDHQTVRQHPAVDAQAARS
jgi:GDP-L-fucose synthase